MARNSKLTALILLTQARERNRHCSIRQMSNGQWRINLHGAFGGTDETAMFENTLNEALDLMDGVEQWCREQFGHSVRNMFGD